MTGINSLPDLPTELHKVYDTQTDSYWSNVKGKSVWAKSGHAKNAWCTSNAGTFNKQNRYVIHTFEPTEWRLSNSQLPLNLE